MGELAAMYITNEINKGRLHLQTFTFHTNTCSLANGENTTLLTQSVCMSAVMVNLRRSECSMTFFTIRATHVVCKNARLLVMFLWMIMMARSNVSTCALGHMFNLTCSFSFVTLHPTTTTSGGYASSETNPIIACCRCCQQTQRPTLSDAFVFIKDTHVLRAIVQRLAEELGRARASMAQDRQETCKPFAGCSSSTTVMVVVGVQESVALHCAAR